MKLKSSKLCINCETLYEEPGACPQCGSQVFLRLSPVLGTILEEDKGEPENCPGTVENNIPQPAVSLHGTSFSLERFVTERIRSGLPILSISMKGARKMVRDFVASQLQLVKVRSGLRL
jgi:hypothetical protein